MVSKLNLVAEQAGLTAEQKKQISSLSAMLDTHTTLMKMPGAQAQQAYSQKTPAQKDTLLNFFGGDQTPDILGNAAHYAVATIKKPFQILNDISDWTTRVYRTAAIAIDQSVGLGKAWELATDSGDKAFSPERIARAKELYGEDMMNVAVKVASGQSLDKIMIEGTEAEKEIAASAAQLQDKDALFKRALNAAQAAKYSFGRMIANAILPESMEGGGALYTGISGTFDAAFRIVLDPTLVLGKAKKAFDAGSWLFFNVLGKEKYTYGRSLLGTINNDVAVDRVFANPKVTNFFDTYGAELDKLYVARKAGAYDAATEASTMLQRIAPEFGPVAVDEFIRAGVKNAETAKNYLKNVSDVTYMLRGQAARKTPLVPQLDAARKARIALLTTTDRVFNLDKVGKEIVDNLYGLSVSTENVIETLTTKPEVVAKAESGSFRFTNKEFSRRVDRFAAKFSTVPYFKDNFFDVHSPDAATKVYQLARLGNSRYHAKILAEAFRAGDEGQKEQIFKGIWTTLAEIKGWNKSTAGLQQLDTQFTRVQQYAPTITREVVDELGNVTKERFNPASFDGEQLAVLDWQLSSGIRVPNIMELNSYVAKDALTARMFGPNYKRWMDKTTSWWVFGTLAGPRFVIRNSIEDLLIHAAIGESPFGVLAGRQFVTRMGIAGSEGKLGFVNKIVRRKSIAKYASKLEDAKKTGDAQAIRRVMAEALIDDNLGKVYDKAGAKLVANHLNYTNIDDYLGGIEEGGKNALRGASQFMNVTQDISKYGSKMGALESDGLLYKAATGSSFGDIAPTVSQENRISWMFTITANANSDLGALAIKYLAPNISRKTAVNGIRAYLDELPEAARGRFQLYSKPGITSQQHAESIYDTVRQYFVKRDGELNTDLLSKVRTVEKDGKVKVSSANLHLEDIPGKFEAELAPEFISGPILVPYAGDNFTSGFMEMGWDAMGAANGRLTRLPLAQDSLVSVLKDMEASGFRKRYIEKLTANLEGEALIKANANAERQLAAMAEDLAKNRVLSFVDNPEVRTQLAMNVRNFARFYRSTEDFYRRVVRAVRYNPESLARASLTYEGIAHSGWVQTDDKGEQYFFYPGLTPVYNVMAKLGPLFGVKDAFKAPMPVEFGAQIKMITPSLNPDSLFPTFSGPLAALPLRMVGNVIPAVADLEKYFLGNYGEDQPLISSVLPAHVNRLLAAMNRDERSSQYASAMRKAATYLQASGHGIETTIDPNTGMEIAPTAGELNTYQDKLQASTVTVLAMRFIFGFFAPASPQVTLKSDMAKWARDNGRMNYKQVFNKMVEAYNGDVDKAVGEWIKYYPDQMPYTVSESDTTTVANVRAMDQATNWVEQNKPLLDKYPEAAAFLIPQAGKFDFNAYKLLFAQGIKTNKTVTDFVREIAVAKDREIYYTKKDEFDAMLAGTLTTEAKRQVNAQWDAWSSEFKGARPLLQEALGKGAQTAIQRNNALEDLRLMVNDTTIKVAAPTRKILREMLAAYDSYIAARDYADQPGVSISRTSLDQIKAGAKGSILSLAGNNPNAIAAYNSLFAPLFR